jgi:putative FmdB family regulatory protein
LPIYEFECEECAAGFEELVAVDAPAACPERGPERTWLEVLPCASALRAPRF